MRVLNHKRMVAPDCAAPPCGERLGRINRHPLPTSAHTPAACAACGESATDANQIDRSLSQRYTLRCSPLTAGRHTLMKIARVEAIYLRLPDVNARADGTQDTLIVRVHTGAGLVGLGEVDSSPLVAKAVIEAPLSHATARGLADCVMGQDPLEIDRLWQRMYNGAIFFGRGGAAQQAMSGVDMALWDIAGKAYGQPVYKLLGGGDKKHLRAYGSILFGDSPAE